MVITPMAADLPSLCPSTSVVPKNCAWAAWATSPSEGQIFHNDAAATRPLERSKLHWRPLLNSLLNNSRIGMTILMATNYMDVSY